MALLDGICNWSMVILFVVWTLGVETSVWTADEVEAYQQAMMKYDKDFFLVSKQVNVYLFTWLTLITD